MTNRHLHRFKMDAARWIRPEEIADLVEVTPGRVAIALFKNPSLRAVGWFRLGGWAKSRGIPGVPGYVQRRLLRLYGLEMSAHADIAGGLYIAHPVGCVLAAERIGENATIVAGVTFGARGTARWPRLGDRVFVGAGARILGDIEIGSDASIGANAVVLQCVPPGATAVGIPARIVKSAVPTAVCSDESGLSATR